MKTGQRLLTGVSYQTSKQSNILNDRNSFSTLNETAIPEPVINRRINFSLPTDPY